ncbi:MAG: hydrogenase maturation protease [Kiloniellales bacterium]|nr:hydrogenase maturation protease [Kiloniellales bacterium]
MSSAPDSGIIIGVGHSERRDDGVGPYVAGALKRRGLPAVTHEGDGSGLLDLWEARPACIVIDAISGGEAPGRLPVFTDLDDPAFRRAGFVHSTHRLGLPEAVALGRTLGRLPRRLVVIGIAGANFGFGSALSPPVVAAAERLIDALAGAEDPFGDAVLAALDPMRQGPA